MKFSNQAISLLGAGVMLRAGATKSAVDHLQRRLHSNVNPREIVFNGPCTTLPANRVPHTSNTYDGWKIVDFCLAGATGDEPASGTYPHQCHHNDDDSSYANLQFTFKLFGNSYDHVYINNNGNLSFEDYVSAFVAQGFPINTPMVAPFWSDVDTGDNEDTKDLGHVWMKETGTNTFAVTWDDVGFFDENDYLENNFQVMISDGTNPEMGIGNNICFCYETMEWTTGDWGGDLFGGVNGFGGAPATVGANKGDNSTYWQLSRFNRSGVDFEDSNGVSGVEYLNHRHYCINGTGDNIPPIADGFSAGTLTANKCQPLSHTINFLSGEPEQTTTITSVVHGSISGLSIITSAGNKASAVISYTPQSDETFDITFTAQDNGNPAQQTTRTLTITGTVSCPSISGDPHIRTWSGIMYDFHGVCDLVLLQNPDFENGLGLNIHVRTKQMSKFSYVSSAATQIGNDILEVMGDNNECPYWINKQSHKNANDGIVGLISGYSISYIKSHSKQHKFTVDLGNDKAITMTTYKQIVRVDIIGATEQSFGKSLGLLGSYGSGKMVARDGMTVLEDADAFGREWQVLPFEEMLFHSVEGPQAPERCEIPIANALRRRLLEFDISDEQAKTACAHVGAEDFDMCVFDVIATGDKDMVGAY